MTQAPFRPPLPASGHEVAITRGLPERLDAEIRGWPCPGDLARVAVPWTLLVQDANPSRVDLVTVEARRGGALRAVAIVHVVRRLAVGDYTGGVLERITRAGRALGWTPLAFDVAYLELPFLNASGALFAPDVDEAERLALWRALLGALDDLDCDALCVKGRTDDGVASAALAGAGMVRVPFVEEHVVTLPGERPSFEAWLGERSANRRSNIRRHLKRFAAAGGSIESARSASEVASRVAELFSRTQAKVRAEGELPHPMDAGAALYERLAERLGERGEVRLATIGGEIIAFSLLLHGNETVFLRFVGMDYVKSQDARAYFCLFYDAVAQAAARGVRHVHLGNGTAHVKEPLGGARIATEYHVAFRRRLRPVAPIFRHLLTKRFGALGGETGGEREPG